VVGIFPGVANADDTTDLYFQVATERYYNTQQNARTFGMAGSSVPTTSDSSSIVGNPAGLGFMRGGEFSGTYSYDQISGDEFPTGVSVDQNSNIGSTLLAIPLQETPDGLPTFGNLGIGWSGVDSRWEDDTFGTLAQKTQVFATYAYAIDTDLSLGYNLTWTDDKFQSRDISNYTMGDGFKHTLGAQWKAAAETVIGAAIFFGHGTHHALFGPGIRKDSDTNLFGFDIGVSHDLTEELLLTAAAGYSNLDTDGNVKESIPANVVGGSEEGDTYDFRIGAEYAVAEATDLRAGYRFAGLDSYDYSREELDPLDGSANYNALSLGIGQKFSTGDPFIQSINLDYGVEVRFIGDTDWQHVVTVSIPYSFCGIES
jgi:long-subunit fatty acid transport protein